MCCDGYFLFRVLLAPGLAAPHHQESLTSPSPTRAPARPPPRPILFKSPIPLNLIPCYAFRVVAYLTPKGASTMEWVTPQHEEVDLNCEVSSYANAEL